MYVWLPNSTVQFTALPLWVAQYAGRAAHEGRRYGFSTGRYMSTETLKLCGIVILLAPLAGAILAGAVGPIALKARSHWAAILGVGGAFVAALVLFREVGAATAAPFAAIPVYDWLLNATPSPFRVEFLVDPLTAIMLVTVTGISLLVVVYSRDYMRKDNRPEHGYERFFAFLSLFVFSMCALLLSGNFLLLYLGWEAVGLCSYLLIGFHYSRPAAASAAKKAFLVNRVGDFGFGLGILLIYLTFGTLEYGAVFDMVHRGVNAAGEPVAADRMTAIALLLFCGACGKSAQLPLHVWLPDAMEGPSPVSALIHAATMVTAGVYMIARCGAIFASSAAAMTLVAVVGAVTALFAATIAVVQTDLKRVLAYSTISQLGYMVLGVGVDAANSSVLHLVTHAFFKALLFLGAGSVMHALGGIIDVRHFSGLRKIMPVTFVTFVIGSLALAGFPLLSGFFSKDEILHHALEVYPLLGVMGLLTAIMTAFYSFRIVFLAFFGPQRVPHGVHPHESGRWMLVPLCLLSIGAIGAGYVGAEGTGSFHRFLAPVFENTFAAHVPHSALAPTASARATFWSHYALMIISGSLSMVGILCAYVVYLRETWIPGFAMNYAVRVHRLLWRKYYVDEFYELVFVRSARQTGRTCVGLDDYFIDGLIWLVTAIPRGVAYALRGLQTGLIQSYGLSMVVGLAVMMWMVLR